MLCVVASSIAWEDQVSMVFDWLRDDERPANLVYWYIDQPDWAGHEYGPDSPQVSTQCRVPCAHSQTFGSGAVSQSINSPLR